MKSIATLFTAIRQWLNRKPDLEEPGPGVRVPIHKGPGGRTMSAVVELPD